MIKIKKSTAVILSVLIALVVTNPTNEDFEHFMAAKDSYSNLSGGGRTSYFLLFSIYEYRVDDNSSMPKQKLTYLGVFKNFFLIDKKDEE